jgi:hypothetical protein
VEGWRAPEVVRRSLAIARGTPGLRTQGTGEPEAEPAFLSDPALEEPSFSFGDFLQIELRRMRYTLTRGRAGEVVFERGLAALDEIHAVHGDRLLILLVPDEYQVNDALWHMLLPSAAKTYTPALPLREGLASFDRDLPQRRIHAWAEARGARVLDVLPALREAEKRARTYHLRDTHWNAHGNRVAGAELADALLAHALD